MHSEKKTVQQKYSRMTWHTKEIKNYIYQLRTKLTKSTNWKTKLKQSANWGIN